jgi:hypothetical protein
VMAGRLNSAAEGGYRMLSGSDRFRRLDLFPIAVAVAVLVIILPFVTVLVSDNTGIIGIPYTESPIVEDSDVFEQAWHFWWVSSALKNGQDPRFCPVIFTPEGASLVYNHIGWFDTLLFAIIGMGADSPVLSHTLSLLLGSLLTGLFGYLLARSWGAGKFGALFAALAMVWMPSRIARLLQHYQLANCWTLPAAMWLCRRYLKESGFRILALFSIIAVLGSLQSPFFTIFILLGIAASGFISGGSWKSVGYLALSWSLSAVILAILIYTSNGDHGSVSTNWREAIYWAPEPQSFILPSPFGLVARLTGLQPRVSWMSNTAEGVVTPGLTVLAAFLIFVWRKKNWKLAAVVLTLSIIALGPELRIFGRPLGVPLPFRLVQLFPFLNGIRAPSRFIIISGVFVALGAGLGISQLKPKWKLIFFLFILLELSVPYFGTLSISMPSACREIPEEGIVLELPVDNNIRRYSAFQMESDYSRRYAFLARMICLPEEDELLQEAADNGYILVYHRWLFNEDDRDYYDSVYAGLFPGESLSDSVWIFDNGGSL